MSGNGENRIHIAGFGPADIALLKEVADRAAEETTKRWFTLMGLDPTNPIGAQRDFSMLRYLTHKLSDDEFKADMDWTRRTRRRTQGMLGKAVMTAVVIAVVGAGHTVWAGMQTMFTK